jgi:hypothetical protein
MTKEEKLQILVNLAVRYIQDNDVENPDYVGQGEYEGTSDLEIESDFADGSVGYLKGRYVEDFEDDSDYSREGYGYCPTITECVATVDSISIIDKDNNDIEISVADMIVAETEINKEVNI